MSRTGILDSVLVAGEMADSLLVLNPTVRYSSDSLAKADSLDMAYIARIRAGHYYFHQDTVKATFAFIETVPWSAVWNLSAKARYWRDFAKAASESIIISHSPNMARLTYQAFERAKRLAIDYGDPHYIHLADSSYRAVARQVLTMPDSVRAAFGPPPDRPARVPWVLATLAAAFIAASVAGSWGWNGNTQAPRFARPLSEKKRR